MARRRKRSEWMSGLEQLEARDCRAAWAQLADAGTTLVIEGDDAADQVTITQDDVRGTLTVTGVGQNPSVFAAARVGTVKVDLRGGDDRFEYATANEVRQRKQLRVDLGDGSDTAIVRWADDGAKAAQGVNVILNGGAGDDALGFRIGKLGPGAVAILRADGGAGNDALGVQCLPPSRAGTLAVALRGGAGNDSLAVYSTGTLPAFSRAGFDLRGGDGDDQIDVNVAGRVVGRLSCRINGGAGNDQLVINATNATGLGRLGAELLGGAGDDQFAVLGDQGVLNAIVDGGTGDNAAQVIRGVQVRNVQHKSLPTAYELHTGPLPSFNPVLPTTTLARDGRTVEYYSAGTSAPGQPVVVLLTGFGGDIDSWQTVPGRLAAGSQVIAVNRPGYRQSSPATADYAQTAIDDIRAVVQAVAPGRSVVLVGHSLGGLYANLYARLRPSDVAGVVFVDATAPEAVKRIDDLGIPFGGLGDPTAPELRLEQPGVRQEIEGVVSLAHQVLAGGAFPAVPVVSLRAGPADLMAADPEGDAWYQALGALGSPGETRRVPDSGHNVQFDRPATVVTAVSDVLATVARSADNLFVSSVLAEAASKYGVPGLVGVVIDGHGMAIGSTGVRQADAPASVRAGDLFQNGSTTKAMTATLAGVLVDRGQIRWNTTIGQMFPELRSVIRPEYTKVTLQQLLQHRGGIIADDDSSADLNAALATLDESDPKVARLTILPFVLKEPAHPTGAFRYSNAGFTIVAAMLERATGKRYEDLMQTYVFDPLGMASATFGPPTPGQPVGHDASGHPVAYGSPEYLTNDLPVLNPAGANLRMSVGDWAKFVRVHMGQTVNGVRLIKPATLVRLHTPSFGEIYPGVNYAGGWAVAAAGTGGADATLGKILQHDGSDGYWLAEVQAYPDHGFAILIMANAAQTADGQDLSVAFKDINARLAERFAAPAATHLGT